MMYHTTLYAPRRPCPCIAQVTQEGGPWHGSRCWAWHQAS